ncbi:hypothetical protein THIX_90281 [Thiomonas sp. X19]|uniref:hypothetical protein n=1 Tax=Thiomonas sp. X19 TaxID=1050370 RepID=UPI000B6C1F44|nr:hypothetical protein [Thiomonas sp. X19]SCC95512.1 hypothetical protein THIX_90281 [Thiomonas sp. X19]
MTLSARQAGLGVNPRLAARQPLHPNCPGCYFSSRCPSRMAMDSAINATKASTRLSVQSR